MELATVDDENPCGDRGLDAVCPPVAIDGTDGEKWRRRESNPRADSRNSLIDIRLWNMLQDVGVPWEWKDDAKRRSWQRAGILQVLLDTLAGRFS